MMADLSKQPARLVKLHKSLALHRLLVIFISSNQAYYVVIPCLQILESCLVIPGLDNIQKSFETEGGFALLARTLGPMWRNDVQAMIFRMIVGSSGEINNLLCPPLVSCLLTALDSLLQSAGEGEEGGNRPTHARTRSGTVTIFRSVAMSPIVNSTCP